MYILMKNFGLQHIHEQEALKFEARILRKAALKNKSRDITYFNDMDHNQTEAKKTAFEIGNEDIKLLLKEGAQEYFKKEFPDIKNAFLKKLEAVVCMDEGCAHRDYNGEGKLCLAGSGILYPASSEEERIQKVAELLVAQGIIDITSHEGCGATGLAYKRDFPGANPTPKQIEDYGKDWARKLAEEIGRMGYEEKYDHITAEEMERPKEFHNARVVYYDGIGGFNPNKEVGLPMGFVISREFVPAEYVVEELKVAVNIAFGHHGFGDLFSSEMPFVVIPMAGTEEKMEILKKEIKDVLTENKNFKNGKIKVDGSVIK